MVFEFATATRIIFGAGRVAEAAPLAAGWGRRVLVVCGLAAERAQFLQAQLAEHQVASELFLVTGEPTLAVARQGTRLAQQLGAEVVIGLGGGSAVDTGKAIAALLTNPGDPLDYVEVIGRGQRLTHPPVPYLAIPTTAGTGAEVTRNAVLSSPEHKVKVSLRSPLLLPRVALVDPELTYDLPPDVTAATGLDALTQLIEPYVCNQPNPLIDALCREGIRRAAGALRRACEPGRNTAARAALALASLFGGLALANARLGAVHGLAAPLGGQFPAPHGAVCARLLPAVMRMNVRALQARQPESETLARYTEVARLLTGWETATAWDGAAWVAELTAALRIPPLAAYGVHPADFPDLIAKAAAASSMQGNPIKLTETELAEVLTETTG